MGTLFFLCNDVSGTQIQKDNQKDFSVEIRVILDAFFSDRKLSTKLCACSFLLLARLRQLNWCIPALVLKGREFQVGWLDKERLGL